MKIVREGRVIASSIQSNSQPLFNHNGPIGIVEGIPTGQFTIKTDSGTEFEIRGHHHHQHG